MSDLIFSSKLGVRSFNLDIPERRGVLEALFKNEPFDPEGQDESVQNIYAWYKDAEDEFRGFGTVSGDVSPLTDVVLLNFAYWLMYKVGVIEISTSDDTYAYAIFETMNDRGKPLSPTDMLKAYLLARITDNDSRKAANQRWREQIHHLLSVGSDRERDRDATFIKAWLRAQYADEMRPRIANAEDRDWERIGGPFHRWARDNAEKLGLGENRPQSFERFITERLPLYASIYEQIHAASQVLTSGLESIFYNAVNEFTLQNTVLLAPISPDDDRDTIRRKLQVTATYLDIYLVRRVVNYVRVTYSSVSYAMFSLIKEIRGKPLDELVSLLEARLAADELTFDGYPSKGRNGLRDLALNMFTKRYIHYILARITAHVEVESDRPNNFMTYVDKNIRNPFDIEHIWPDKWSRYRDDFEREEDFVFLRNQVASLVLLPSDLNRSLQAKDYSAKVEKYASQNLLAASLNAQTYQHNPRFLRYQERQALPFRLYADFKPATQQERLALYGQLIERIWGPQRLRQEAGRSLGQVVHS